MELKMPVNRGRPWTKSQRGDLGLAHVRARTCWVSQWWPTVSPQRSLL